MGIASHPQRLKRLEASRGAAEQHLVFDLSDWASGCPVALKSDEEEKALLPGFKAAALDNLVAAGKIRECDRERVVFIVRVLVSSSRPEKLEPCRVDAMMERDERVSNTGREANTRLSEP